MAILLSQSVNKDLSAEDMLNLVVSAGVDGVEADLKQFSKIKSQEFMGFVSYIKSYQISVPVASQYLASFDFSTLSRELMNPKFLSKIQDELTVLNELGITKLVTSHNMMEGYDDRNHDHFQSLFLLVHNLATMAKEVGIQLMISPEGRSVDSVYGVNQFVKQVNHQDLGCLLDSRIVPRISYNLLDFPLHVWIYKNENEQTPLGCILEGMDYKGDMTIHTKQKDMESIKEELDDVLSSHLIGQITKLSKAA